MSGLTAKRLRLRAVARVAEEAGYRLVGQRTMQLSRFKPYEAVLNTYRLDRQ